MTSMDFHKRFTICGIPPLGVRRLRDVLPICSKRLALIVPLIDSAGLITALGCRCCSYAEIPVLQLSIQPHLGPEQHLCMGQALATLRRESVLIIGSGSFTHNLFEFRGHEANDAAPTWVNSFADWFDAALMKHQMEDLLNYRRLAPYAVENHPTEEHLLPLYVALGAAGGLARAERLHAGATYSVIRMDVYTFRAFNEPAQNKAAPAYLGATEIANS